MLQKCKFILVAFMITAISAKAQNFNYALSKDSTAYTTLSGAIYLSNAESWSNKTFKLRLPFQFNFCGSITDSLTIEGNGFIVFDQAKQLSIVAFNNFRSNKDTNQNYTASIAHITEGVIGNRIVKIEFKNLSQNNLSSGDHLNYQIWLYENGNKIEVHIGTNSYSADIELPCLIGLINRNMNTETKAKLITGNPSSASLQIISGEAEMVYINNVPNNGITYTLIPTF